MPSKRDGYIALNELLSSVEIPRLSARAVVTDVMLSREGTSHLYTIGEADYMHAIRYGPIIVVTRSEDQECQKPVKRYKLWGSLGEQMRSYKKELSELLELREQIPPTVYNFLLEEMNDRHAESQAPELNRRRSLDPI